MSFKRAGVIASVFVVLVVGSAFAGRGGGGHRMGGGGGGRVVHGGGGGGRVVVRHTETVRVAPAYNGGNRVVARERYVDRNRHPAVIVESYGRRPGYYWAPGDWQWSGDEWIWYPGHYEVDAAYRSGPVRVYGRY